MREPGPTVINGNSAAGLSLWVEAAGFRSLIVPTLRVGMPVLGAPAPERVNYHKSIDNFNDYYMMKLRAFLESLWIAFFEVRCNLRYEVSP